MFTARKKVCRFPYRLPRARVHRVHGTDAVLSNPIDKRRVRNMLPLPACGALTPRPPTVFSRSQIVKEDGAALAPFEEVVAQVSTRGRPGALPSSTFRVALFRKKTTLKTKARRSR